MFINKDLGLKTLTQCKFRAFPVRKLCVIQVIEARIQGRKSVDVRSIGGCLTGLGFILLATC